MHTPLARPEEPLEVCARCIRLTRAWPALATLRSVGKADRPGEGVMKNILVAGIGSVLLGDDGIGPYVVRMLEANYAFDEGVEIEDLGTPALDLIDHIAGLDV